ncbi:MAG: RNA methyltransferase [Sediminibacterium sp.]
MATNILSSLSIYIVLASFFIPIAICTSVLFVLSWVYLCAMRKLSMDELDRMTVAQFKEAKKNPIVVVLDNIRSMHNVGSVFRTADAFRIEAICLCGYTPQPPHRDIQKTALGATETVNWLYYPTTKEAIEDLKKFDYTVLAIEQVEGSESLDQFNNTDRKLAIVLGNEVEGVDAEALAICDGCIEIPQLGMKHSLNISVAAGIVLWKLSESKLAQLKG